MITQSTPLLALLDQRWNDEIKNIPDPTAETPARRPIFNTEALRLARQAAMLHAEANNSDPFAGARALHNIKRGYWRIDDVRKDALAATSARRASGATFPAVAVAA